MGTEPVLSKAEQRPRSPKAGGGGGEVSHWSRSREQCPRGPTESPTHPWLSLGGNTGEGSLEAQDGVGGGRGCLRGGLPSLASGGPAPVLTPLPPSPPPRALRPRWLGERGLPRPQLLSFPPLTPMPSPRAQNKNTGLGLRC